MLGIKGVSVVLVHLGLNFSVAKVQKPALSWVCNLLLLSTLHIQPLQEIQVGSWKMSYDYKNMHFSNVKELKLCAAILDVLLRIKICSWVSCLQHTLGGARDEARCPVVFTAVENLNRRHELV